MASQLEERFARSLASNDIKTRARTLKRLSEWITARSSLEDGFTDLEFLKLWKGLYMCMWHSDKPLVQEELAANIAHLLLVMRRSDVSIQFLRTFFTTLAREWHSIDRLRLDKFYMLIRKVVGNSFKMLKDWHWDKQFVSDFVTFLENGPLCADVSKTSLGIQLHVLDVYIPELVAHSPGDSSLELLRPCLRLLASSREPSVTECVCTSVVNLLTEEDCQQQLQVSVDSLSDTLRTLAIDRNTVGRNRKIIYTYCKRFSNSTQSDSKNGCGLPELKKPKSDLKKKRGKIRKKILRRK